MSLFGPHIKQMKEKGDKDGLVRNLKNADTRVRVKVVRALGELKYIEGLLEASKNENVEVRAAAIEALKNLEDPEAVVPLFEILENDTDETIQQEAFEALTSLGVKEGREIAKMWASVGNATLKKENPQIALKCFDEATRIEPGDKELIGSIAAALSDYGIYQDALKYAEKCTQIDPKDARGWGLKGICLFHLDNEEEAFSCCKRALEIDPKLGEARGILSAIYYNRGDYEVLAAHERETLTLDPENIKARVMLSDVLALSNKLADAQAEVQEALEMVLAADYANAEDLAMIYQQLGILSVMRGHEGALEYFEKSIRANQRDQWIYKVADAYIMLNMFGGLMEGTPQERRAKLLGYAQNRKRTYGSYLQWKQENGL